MSTEYFNKTDWKLNVPLRFLQKHISYRILILNTRALNTINNHYKNCDNRLFLVPSCYSIQGKLYISKITWNTQYSQDINNSEIKPSKVISNTVEFLRKIVLYEYHQAPSESRRVQHRKASGKIQSKQTSKFPQIPSPLQRQHRKTFDLPISRIPPSSSPYRICADARRPRGEGDDDDGGYQIRQRLTRSG